MPAFWVDDTTSVTNARGGRIHGNIHRCPGPGNHQLPAILFNRAGEIVSRAQHPFRQIYPQPGWVEHDPLEIWATEKRALAEVVGAAHIDPKRIAALGITNQRETTILWDRSTGQPVCNAIVWQCRRTAPLCDTLKADGLGPWWRSGRAC